MFLWRIYKKYPLVSNKYPCILSVSGLEVNMTKKQKYFKHLHSFVLEEFTEISSQHILNNPKKSEQAHVMILGIYNKQKLSLCTCAVSSEMEPLLFANLKYGSRPRIKPSIIIRYD